MPNYRRAFVPGGCWFFTVNLHDRRQRLLVEHIAALRAAVAATRRDYSFTIDAFVVLRTTFMRSGRFPAAMPTFRCGGD
ncbi:MULTISPECIES: hypothetical protein [Bradyrhizobium]|uniref:hypothetical protein n=1 Tax=Bradyrhizobium TaxID=374 RepID=UPI002303A718|nr:MULTISPECIES: hypothetical protein [Bradyrhizobium]MDF0495660.1 hypothetical protein [Bradyrhizobium yuanmingense]